MLGREQLFFIALYVIAAGIYLLTQKRRFPFHYLVKAAPIIILLFIAINADTTVRIWVMLALLFSAAGDVALSLDGERYFVHGLALFLIAHLWYVVAFGQTMAFQAASIIPLTFITLFALYLIRKLYPALGGLRIPVLCYIAVIIAMGVAASLHAPFSWLLIAGAIIFMLSDSSIAIHKFLHPIPGRDFIVMSTYYVAQFLLVMGFVL